MPSEIIKRWDPVLEMEELQRRMSTLFGGRLGWRPVREKGITTGEDAKEYTIKVELLGVKKERLRLEVEGGVLSIKVQMGGKDLEGPSLALPGDVDRDRITAEFKDSVLTVHLPKGAKDAPPKVPIQITETETALDTLLGIDKGLTELTEVDKARSAMSKAFEAIAQSVTNTFTEEKAPSESKVLLSALNAVGNLLQQQIAEKFETNNAVQMARLRGEVSKLELLDEVGPMLTLGEVADALNVSKQAVHKRLQSGSLFGIKAKGEIRIPAWQIREKAVVPGIAKVLNNLDTTDWGKVLFLHSENMQLEGRKPMDLILEGRETGIDRVAEVAALFGEQGAK
jgi:HSP20 family protein